jgi:choice-of-anchor C domain-containing protein
MTLPAPKHYWNFNETSGTVAADAIGAAVIALDRPGWVPGRQGNAIRFNPTDGVRLATTNLTEMPPPWTAAFWVKREADSEGATLWSSNGHALKLEQWRNTHQVGLTGFGVFDETFEGKTPIGEWVHLAVVGTATETKLYLNGRLQGTLARSTDLGLQWLGSSGGYMEVASAILDEVKIFDVALTDAQVAELAGETLDGPNLIKNGSFEQGVAVSGQYVTLSPGSQDITGWTVTRGPVDYTTTTLWDAADGSLSLDLNGLSPGGIKQTIETIPGAVYSVSFALAGNCGAGPDPKGMRVEVTPSTNPQAADFQFSIAGRSYRNMGWQRHTWQFTAQATTTTIEFYSLSGGANGPVLDDVRVWLGAPGAGR